MANDGVITEVQENVGYVTLSRPEVLNAMNQALRLALTRQLQLLNENPDVRVVVLKGTGRAFCAGQDQRESRTLDQEGASARIQTYCTLFDAMRRMTKPVVARLHGFAVGAGLQLALLADLRIASEDLRVGLPELDIGSPCITGSGILWPIAGEAVVRRLVLTGDLVGAHEAERLGLVHEVVPPDELDDHVTALVAKLIEKPETPMRLTKEWLRLLTEEHFTKTWDQATETHAKNYVSGELTRGAERFLARKR